MAVTTRGDGAVPTPFGPLAGPVVVTLAGVGAPITFNTAQADSQGVEWWVGDLEGWEFPDVSVEPLPRVGRHGVWVPPSWFRGRTVTMRGTFVAPDLATAQQATAQLAAAAALTTTPGVLSVYEHDPSRLDVRLAGRVRFDRSRAEGRHVGFEISLVAADPRRYGLDEQSVTFGVIVAPATGHGITFPLDFDFDFGSEGEITGGTPVQVGGTVETPPHFTFRGPCTAPAITNLTTNKTWRYTGSLLAGERLEVDIDAATVLLNGTGNRYHLVDPKSDWWLLVPGQNVLTYTAAGAGSGDVTVKWRSAWL
jgi:Phage tail protein